MEPTVEDAMRHHCPTCGARPTKCCSGSGYHRRDKAHPARFAMAQAVIARPAQPSPARRAFHKATNLRLDAQYLADRTRALERVGYPKAKWIGFCELMLTFALQVELYEARQTVSKYVTLTDGSGKRYKVRFSNHKPIHAREVGGDCDFFVGVTHLGVTTTTQAIAAALAYFGLRAEERPRALQL
ncbi:hypothetical protein J2J97_32390 (plasmid) [Rhizobium bangladeshense]|uniref:hypothetical protein n=1 Tax=Rhizobium bangladeshense TaxID=1138189 RepID=UPI001A99EF73|nr:hypothetical protein [Rhizobium bangladeshense]QSY98605.1 hypothetical protein J2J97_32390 [Rhizobium bangladeshense]